MTVPLRPPTRSRVLVVEDSATVRVMVRAGLEADGFEVVEAADGEQALVLAADGVDVVLLDQLLPGLDGLGVLAALHGEPASSTVPVIFLSGDLSPALVTTALDAGAHDFLRKPFAPEELVARVRAAARTKRLLDDLARAASTDPLTGLLNRRACGAAVEGWVLHAERYGAAVSLLLVDLDGFKSVNDAMGHAAGDGVLSEVGRRLRAAVRTGDVVGRWGGDEFVVLLPETGLAEARLLGERLRTAVVATAVQLPGTPPVRVGFSFGAADLSGARTTVPPRQRSSPSEQAVDDLVARADADLYAVRATLS